MTSITYAEAAHLLRRAGFGGPPAEIQDLVARGREGAVDYLIQYDRIDNQPLDNVLAASFADGTYFGPLDIQRYWMTRMIFTRRQLEEKMTLFWHNHFATSYLKVPFPFMATQIQMLRQQALGSFDTLLLNVAQDAAMLLWLDGIQNVVGRPNENWARELQELFTMGINDPVTGAANYTEKDVKEIARAFTGWTFKLKNNNTNKKPKFRIIAGLHDDGAKEIYGQTANFSGEDVITVVAARRATARFLVNKLFNFFVYPMTESDEDKATIEKFADVYMLSNHSIAALMRAIFTSDEFFGERARFALVKSPVEYIVGAIRMLGARYNPGTTQLLDFDTPGRAKAMGQELINPPDVSGWKLHLGWLDTATMIERFNFAIYLATNRPANPSVFGEWLTSDQLKTYTRPTAAQTVEQFLTVLGPLVVDGGTTQSLADYLETDDQGNHVDFAVNDATIDKQVRGLVRLLLSLQEFQLS